jgi:hypothetical protein
MKELIIFICLIIGTPVGLIILENSFQEYQCNQYEEITGKETKYSPFDKCYISTENGWQRWDEYKVRVIAKDSLGGN